MNAESMYPSEFIQGNRKTCACKASVYLLREYRSKAWFRIEQRQCRKNVSLFDSLNTRQEES